MPAAHRAYRQPVEVERQILRLLATGLSQTEIGARLHLSRGGVRHYLDHLRRLWALRSVPQLLILAGQLGWTGVPDREWRQVTRPARLVPKGTPPRPRRHTWKGAA